MKKILFIFMLCEIVMLGNAQAQYDTVYFRSNKIEINDTGFINLLVSVIKDDTICAAFQKCNFYSMEVYKTDDFIEVKITMLPKILKWASRAAGHFFLEESLFFIDGDFEDFASKTTSTKRFYYKPFNPNVINPDIYEREFCVMILRHEDNRWRFVEERVNY